MKREVIVLVLASIYNGVSAFQGPSSFVGGSNGIGSSTRVVDRKSFGYREGRTCLEISSDMDSAGRVANGRKLDEWILTEMDDGSDEIFTEIDDRKLQPMGYCDLKSLPTATLDSSELRHGDELVRLRMEVEKLVDSPIRTELKKRDPQMMYDNAIYRVSYVKKFAAKKKKLIRTWLNEAQYYRKTIPRYNMAGLYALHVCPHSSEALPPATAAVCITYEDGGDVMVGKNLSTGDTVFRAYIGSGRNCLGRFRLFQRVYEVNKDEGLIALPLPPKKVDKEKSFSGNAYEVYYPTHCLDVGAGATEITSDVQMTDGRLVLCENPDSPGISISFENHHDRDLVFKPIDIQGDNFSQYSHLCSDEKRLSDALEQIATPCDLQYDARRYIDFIPDEGYD